MSKFEPRNRTPRKDIVVKYEFKIKTKSLHNFFGTLQPGGIV